MRAFLIFLSLSFSYSIFSQDITEKEIQKTVTFQELEHPYLLFDKKGKEQILERIKKDPESKLIWDRLIAEANMLLYKPVDPSIPPRSTHLRAGWTQEDLDNEYGKKIGGYTNHAEVLAFVYQITGDAKYAQKAYEFTEVVCRMPVWTIQAHEFDIIYSRVWPWNVPDNQVNFNFDIGSAMKGQSISLVYDWTYDALKPEQRDRIKGALLEKVITPVRGDYDFHWWASSYRCNWTGVCNGGVGMAAIALIKDYPQLLDVVAESYNRINRMMDELGKDGGWQEGGGYWKYGLDNSILFAAALKNLSHDQYNLFENQKLKANPVSFPVYLYVPPNRSVNFGDSGDRNIGGTDFFNLLVAETGSAEGAWYRNEILEEGKSHMDLIFPRPTIKPTLPEIPSKHFRSIDWWVMRSDFTNPNNVTIAGKAGKNDDPHHGHLDIGHFILFWKGEDFLKDSGRPYYDEEYFDEYRWQYPQASSGGHNTILVNGEQQIPGKLKNQPLNESIGGKVLIFKTSEKQDYVLMDPTNAYPKQELKSWKRHIVLEKPNLTLLIDEVESINANSEIEIRFHSGVHMETKDQYILLKGEKGMMAMIPVSDQPLQIMPGKHAYQPIHGQKQFEWLPYTDVELQTKGNTAVVATWIMPVADENEVEEVIKSITYEKKKTSSLYKITYQGNEHILSIDND
jgi:hypothetical protein